jgi:hypothetical protein
MTLSPFLSVVGDLKSNAIRIGKEGRPIVGSIPGMELGLRCIDAGGSQTVGDRPYIFC